MKKILSIWLIALIWFTLYIGWYVHAGSKYIPPHFHANFALYVNGERIDFTDERFSEDIAWCSISGKQDPEDRVHLHERNQDTIHVHADGVSWGHFFTNNDIIFSENILQIWEDFESQSWTYTASEWGQKITFMLNGKEIKNPFNKLIGSKDKLLISYGNQTLSETEKLYASVSSNAWEYNAKYDPGSCWGTNENWVIILLTEWLHSMNNMEH